MQGDRGLAHNYLERQQWEWNEKQEFPVTFCSETARGWPQTNSASVMEAATPIKQSWDTAGFLVTVVLFLLLYVKIHS